MLRPTYPITVLCQVLELPRSTQYYQPVVPDETDLRKALEAAAQEFPTYGSRRLMQQVRRAPSRVVAGRARVRRLMGELGLTRRPKPRLCRTTNSQHAFGRYPNLVAGRVAAVPDEIWVSDITYIRLHREFIYLAVVMDVFTRDIRGWNLGRSLGQELTLVALDRALCHQRPQIHHSDQGIQYAAPAYIQALQQAGVAISMAAVGEPRENGYAERLMRTIKEEEVALADYEDFEDALRQSGHFIDAV
jgi:putative transposase